MKKLDMLEKVEKLYFNKNYSDISTQDIANIFGINKASLYYYFKSKDVLFLELLNYSFDKFIKNLNIILDKDIKKFIKEYLEFPSKAKNIFATISYTKTCKDEMFKNFIKEKEQIVFEKICSYFSENHGFTKEKTFVLLALLESLSIKKCSDCSCNINTDKLFVQIQDLFIK